VWSARVVGAQSKNLDSDSVVIKIYENAFKDLADTRRILREITLVQSFAGCPRLVQVLDAITPPTPDSSSIALVFRNHGVSLYELLRNRSEITVTHVWSIVYQLLWALRAIHAAGIVMGDMKLSNVLIDESCRVVLCDFNLSLVKPLPAWERLQLRMTETYRAPECMMRAPLADEHACAIDIWGLGCIFAELLLSIGGGEPQSLMRAADRSTSGQFAKLFSVIGTPSGAGASLLEQHQPKIARQWRGKQLPTQLLIVLGANPDAAELIEWMLTFNPAERPTAEMILSLELFTELRREESAVADIKEVDLSSIDALRTEAELRDRTLQLIRAIQELRATAGYMYDGASASDDVCDNASDGKYDNASDGKCDGASDDVSDSDGSDICTGDPPGFESLIETA
jgi:serine/threonine protein kinase